MRPDDEDGGGDPAASQASCLGSKKNSYNQYSVCQLHQYSDEIFHSSFFQISSWGAEGKKKYRKDKPWDHEGIDHWKPVFLSFWRVKLQRVRCLWGQVEVVRIFSDDEVCHPGRCKGRLRRRTCHPLVCSWMKVHLPPCSHNIGNNIWSALAWRLWFAMVVHLYISCVVQALVFLDLIESWLLHLVNSLSFRI